MQCVALNKSNSLMFSFIKSIFKSKPSDTDKSQINLNKEISKSVEVFKNNPRYKELTIEIIDQTSDDDLLYLVFDSLCQHFPKDYTKEFETLIRWNNSRQAMYIIWSLEGEVNNGGFNQFYENSSRQYADLIPDALKLIGATKFADLVQRANVTYKDDNEVIRKHMDGTLEGFSKSYENNPLNKFDNEFYALYQLEDLQKLQVEFVRKNKQDFVGV
jgi:hypothetical protein